MSDIDASFYMPAKAAAAEAVKLDGEMRYAEAKERYERAVEFIIKGMEFDKFAERKVAFHEQATKYLNRIEQLQEALQGSGGGGTAVKKPGATTDDADTEGMKLKAGLESAIVMEKPNVKWSDVAGLDSAKDALKEAVILPNKFPELFVGNRKPWRGILLYGPPGTGKSYLAKAVATEADATFFSVSSSDLVSKWQGESEKLVRSLFEMARARKPSIVFIDEIDSMCGERGQGNESEGARRIKTEFLVQMQGVSNNMDNVLILAATNVPWEIDPAMRRRFEKRIYIPLPEAVARARMFKILIGDTPHSLTDDDFRVLGDRTEGMSGSDLSVCVREALMEPVRKCQTAKFFRPTPDKKWEPCPEEPPCSYCPLDLSYKPAPRKKPCPNCGCIRADLYELEKNSLKVPLVSMDDFLAVVDKTKSSVAARELLRYDDWTKEFGMEGA